MRVAFIEQESQLGGVEYSTLRVASALVKTRLKLLIICPEEGDLPHLARQSGLEVQIVFRPKFSSVSSLWGKRYIANPFGFILTAINVFRSMRIMEKHLQANMVDVIITKGLLAHFYAGLAARRLSIPCIWYVQEEVDKKRGAGLFRTILVRGAQRIPTKIIVDAEALLEQFGDFSAEVDIIYNGIDTEQFIPFSDQEQRVARNKLNIPLDAMVIGQVGRIIPLKGQAILLQSFAHLVQGFPDIHLLFVGAPLFGSEAYENSLKKQAAQWGLAERVHFSGFVADVRQGLAAMDIFVHASVETDSPLSVMEAMSCDLPVVVSGVKGTVEMVNAEVNALVFEPGNSNALTFALEKLLTSPRLRNELGKRARAAVIEKFSLRVSVSQLESLIQKIHAD